jgi:hypothetical protein
VLSLGRHSLFSSANVLKDSYNCCKEGEVRYNCLRTGVLRQGTIITELAEKIHYGKMTILLQHHSLTLQAYGKFCHRVFLCENNTNSGVKEQSMTMKLKFFDSTLNGSGVFFSFKAAVYLCHMT